MAGQQSVKQIQESQTDNKKEIGSALKTIVYMVFSLLVFISGAASFWFFQNKFIKKEPEAKPSLLPEKTPAPSAEAVSPSPSAEAPAAGSTAPLPAKSNFQLIKEALASRHGKPLGETIVTVSKMSEPYAQGGIRFEGEIGGGMWLAFKQGDDWIIVYDGHGTISCGVVDPYGFPAEMVPECWDESSGTSRSRSGS